MITADGTPIIDALPKQGAPRRETPDAAVRPVSLTPTVPLFGARKQAAALEEELRVLRASHETLTTDLERLTALGALGVARLEDRQRELVDRTAEQETALATERARVEADIAGQRQAAREEREQLEADAELRLRSRFEALTDDIEARTETLDALEARIVAAEDDAQLQEVGIYEYRHPLTDAVAYQAELKRMSERIKVMARKDGGAVTARTDWTVNNSAAEGRKMVRDFSKLMLRAYNAEADNLVRGLKPYKLESAADRLTKVQDTIARLGKTMQIQIAASYHELRLSELDLTADYREKLAEEKEREREERARLKEERKAQQEIEQERARLEKERQHHANALAALEAKGDLEAAERLREQLAEVDRKIEDVDYRAANVKAGYVYVISNIGSFGERLVKVGMTRRLDPMDRVRELGDASVPFKFDVHALFFSQDAAGLERELHRRLEGQRVNLVNRRREFFRATPAEVKTHLLELSAEVLEYEEAPEALEYRQSIREPSLVETNGAR